MTTRPVGAELFLCGRTDMTMLIYIYIYIYVFSHIINDDPVVGDANTGTVKICKNWINRTKCGNNLTSLSSYLEVHASLFYLPLHFPVTAPISNAGKHRDNYFYVQRRSIDILVRNVCCIVSNMTYAWIIFLYGCRLNDYSSYFLPSRLVFLKLDCGEHGKYSKIK
jgi:hypothetical protein